MGFDIPSTIEPEIIQYATSMHITTEEAIVRLIQAGLTIQESEDIRIQALLGYPLSDQDAKLMDDVVDIAMKARSVRWEPRVNP
jgi:hypothetical protein